MKLKRNSIYEEANGQYGLFVSQTLPWSMKSIKPFPGF